MSFFTVVNAHNFRGSAIARIVGANVCEQSGFTKTVKMWVFEEKVGGRNLSEIINTEHENVKYLPGFKIPDNVVSVCLLQKEYAQAPMFGLQVHVS